MQIENSNVQVTSQSMPIGNTVLNPFEIDGFTYATDAHTLVKCKSKLVDFDWHNGETPLNVDNVVPQVNTSEIIDLDSIDWDSLMNKDETFGVGKFK